MAYVYSWRRKGLKRVRDWCVGWVRVLECKFVRLPVVRMFQAHLYCACHDDGRGRTRKHSHTYIAAPPYFASPPYLYTHHLTELTPTQKLIASWINSVTANGFWPGNSGAHWCVYWQSIRLLTHILYCPNVPYKLRFSLFIPCRDW